MTDPLLIEKCREYRKNPTPAENKLWQELRNRQLSGVKFRRQHPLAGFILDFYSPEIKLGIEVDGEIHHNRGQVEYDQMRTEILSDYGVLILRFWNSEVEKDLDDVMKKIRPELEIRKGKF